MKISGEACSGYGLMVRKCLVVAAVAGLSLAAPSAQIELNGDPCCLGGFVTVDPSVRRLKHPVAGLLIAGIILTL